MARSIVAVKQETDRQDGAGVRTIVQPGQATSNRVVSPRVSQSTETRPATTSTKTETTPAATTESRSPIHAGIAFSLVIKFHNREPTPIAG